jgi:hypothetical protein
MGAYSYCSQCYNGLPKATPREVIEGGQYCASGHYNTANMTTDELLIELCERIEELERERDST